MRLLPKSKRLLTKLVVVHFLTAAMALATMQVPAQGTTSPIPEMRQKASAGDPASMALYGRALALGDGITQNQEQALDWLRRAAERGNVQGMYWYASMLYAGEGGPANPTLAFSWIKRAAETGHLASMMSLATALGKGAGANTNLPLAYAWISLVTSAEPLRNPANPSLVDFKLRAEKLREEIGKTLSDDVRARAERQASQWTVGNTIQMDAATGKDAPASTGSLPQAPSGAGLPPAPRPLPGSDNPLNQRPTPIDPSRVVREAPKSTSQAPAPSQPQAQAPAQASAAAGAGTAGLRRISSGTAFFVTIQGALLTNYHVIKDCKAIRIIDGQEVKLLAVDVREDLAVLVGPPLGRAVNFRATDRINQGEEVLAYGFPLQSVLATSGQVGAGLVAATNGLRDNPSQIQIDVPLQPGNSGGPLFDRQGDLVGMTVSKLNAQQMARLTGEMPQNVNFAIKHSVIKRFLDQNRLQYKLGTNKVRRDVQGIAEEARTYTVALECLGT